MTSPKIDYSKISSLKIILIIFGLVIFTIWGLVATVISFIEFENYFHPYLFCFCFGIPGLIIGILIAIRIKSAICFTQKMHDEYNKTPVSIVFGFIGTLLFIGVLLNQSFSHVQTVADYKVVDKVFNQGKSRQLSIIKLYVEIDGKINILSCNKRYWDSVRIGQEISISYIKSQIGFDYLVLNDEK